MEDNLKNDILAYIEKKMLKTNRKCGVNPIDIVIAMNIPYSNIKFELGKLYKEKKIKVKEGINSKLIYTNEHN